MCAVSSFWRLCHMIPRYDSQYMLPCSNVTHRHTTMWSKKTWSLSFKARFWKTHLVENRASGRGLWGMRKVSGYLSHHFLPVSWCTLWVLQAVSERVMGAHPIRSTATATQVRHCQNGQQNLPHRPLKSDSHKQMRNTGGSLSSAVSGTSSLLSDKPMLGQPRPLWTLGSYSGPHTDRDNTTAAASPVVLYKEASGALQWANGRTPSRSSQNLQSLG